MAAVLAADAIRLVDTGTGRSYMVDNADTNGVERLLYRHGLELEHPK